MQRLQSLRCLLKERLLLKMNLLNIKTIKLMNMQQKNLKPKWSIQLWWTVDKSNGLINNSCVVVCEVIVLINIELV